MTGNSKESPGGDGELVRFSNVAYDDDLSVIKIVSLSDLEAIRSYAADRRWGASWSSAELLAGQVDDRSPKFLLPVFRNAAGDVEVESLRCHVWFLPKSAPRQGMVSLIDVEIVQFREFRSLSPNGAIAVLKRVLDCYPRAKLN